MNITQFKAFRHLSKNKNIVIQRPSKGNTIVILDKISYISAIEEILNDRTKFSNLDIPAGRETNYITNLEKRISSGLKLLKDKEIIDKAAYKNFKPVESRPGVLYGLVKVHKEAKNGLLPFRPIVLPISKPTYKLAKYLLPFLTPLTQNESTVTDSFRFAEEICKQNPYLYMASLDLESLFTNIPLDETIDISIDSLYKDDENSPKIPQDVFRNLLTVAPKESFFMFNNKFYKQIDGVAMGSPLGPALANIFMCSFRNKWLKDCTHSLKPVFYRRYVDNIFIMFSSLNQVEKFKKYLFSKHPNMKFSLEKENDDHLSFLDINIFREKGKFVTNVYRKKNFSGVFTNFNSFIPEIYKTGLIESLLCRCFNLSSDFMKFHREINILKGMVYKTKYRRDLVDKWIKKLLDKVLTRKVVVSTVAKKT